MTLWNRQRPGRSRDRGAAAGDLVYDLEKPEKGKDGRGTAAPPPAISLLKKELDRAPQPAISLLKMNWTAAPPPAISKRCSRPEEGRLRVP